MVNGAVKTSTVASAGAEATSKQLDAMELGILSTQFCHDPETGTWRQ